MFLSTRLLRRFRQPARPSQQLDPAIPPKTAERDEARGSARFAGATGAGKSSIIAIMNRFYEFQKGEILIDDIDILFNSDMKMAEK